MANKVSRDFVPNLSGLVHPTVEQAIRDLYLRFYKFPAPVTNVTQAPINKQTLVFPGTGAGSGGNGLGTVTFTAITEGYAMFTIEDLTITGPVVGVQEIDFQAMTLDETDLLLYGKMDGSPTSPAFDGSTNPFYGKPNINDGSRFGRHFNPGDYILVNDAHAVPGSYEIMQFDSLNTVDNLRHNPAFPVDAWIFNRGQFNTPISAHDSGCLFYRLLMRDFTVIAKQNSTGIVKNSGIPPFQEWAWANKCVAVLAVNLRGPNGGPDGTVQIANLIPAASTTQPPCPGMRTMNGACYGIGISGTLALGKTADKRFSVQAWHSIRTAYALLRTPIINGTVEVALIYISADRTSAGLIDNAKFVSGATPVFQSYPTTPLLIPPDGRQMPYHVDWTPPGLTIKGAGWPPSILPALSGALDANGNLINGFTPSGGDIVMAPDGEIDCIVTGFSIAGGGQTPKDLDFYFQT